MQKYLKRRALFFSIMLILMAIPFNAFAESENIKEKLDRIIKKDEKDFKFLNKLIKEKELLSNLEEKDILLSLKNLKKNNKYKISILYGFSNKKTASAGEKVEIYAHEIQDKKFSSWSSSDIKIQNPKNKFTNFTMIDKNIKIVATFVDIDSGSIDEEEIENEETEDNQNNDLNEIDRENNMKNLKKKRKKSKNK